MKKINRFVTFSSDERFDSHALDLIGQAKSSNWFNQCNLENPEKIEKDNPKLWNSHSHFIKSNPRGYGYWLWKPILILNNLLQMKKGSLLCYADAGCTISPNAKKEKKLEEIVCALNEDNFIVTGFATQRIQYTKKDLLIELDMLDNAGGRQRAATSVVIYNNKRSLEFVKKWIEIGCKDNYHYIDDSPSKIDTEFPEFREHRHDQAILDLLCDKFNIARSQKHQTQAFINYSRTTPKWIKGYK